MSRVTLSDMRLGGQRVSKAGKAVRGVIFVLFLLQFGLVYARLWDATLFFGEARWPEGVLLVLTAAALLASLNAQQPVQNVMFVAVVIAALGGLAHTVGALSGIPFGPLVFTKDAGPTLFGPLPWSMPVLWVVAVLACRGTARLILRPWRTARNYGLWVIGVTIALVVLFDLALEPFATQAHAFWKWHPAKLKLEWYTASVVNFLGWALVSALMLAFVTPSLINKKPVKFPPQYQPLAIWLLVNALFATSAAQHHLWPAFWVTTITASAALVLTAYGLKQQSSAKPKDRQRS